MELHGVLNVVSWGIMFPVGAIIARYLRTFQSADPAWFYLHSLCQFSSNVIGVARWGTGLKLGSESKGVQYTHHRNIGIALFCLATVQVTIDLSTHVFEPRKKNLFLQSLYKEEQEKSHMTNGNNNGKHAFHSDIQDKDIVEALENEV
ncbi:unnamed protein product [Camellia sinensis]